MLITLVNTNRIRPAIAPIAFDYLHEPLVEAGFQVELLDLCFADDWRAEVAAYCARRQPSFWGVTLRNTEDTFFASKESFLSLVAEMVGQLRRQSRAPVILGGVGFSIMPERLLDHCGADFGIVREGEVSLPLLLTRLANGQPYEDVPGLVFRSGGQLRRNAPAELELSTVPVHRRALVDNPRYFSVGGMAGVETKRGCSRVCAYCVEPMVKGRKVRGRAPAQIADELESLVARGVDVFHVNDSEFNLDLRHAAAFCQELVRRGLHRRLRWFAYGMPSPFPEEFAALMVEAGCVGMNFGIDSANDEMLRRIRRTFRRKHIAQTVRICKALGLTYMLELLLGMPGETGETVRDTIDFLKQIDADLVSVTAGVRIFPGTELEALVKAEGLTKDNPNLHGPVEGNEGLLQPLYYLSSRIAPDPQRFISECVGGDPRFFPTNSNTMNYNANALLVEEIAAGARGAYWSILARIHAARHAEAARGRQVAG